MSEKRYAEILIFWHSRRIKTKEKQKKANKNEKYQSANQ